MSESLEDREKWLTQMNRPLILWSSLAFDGPGHPVDPLDESRELLVRFVLPITTRGCKKVLVCDLARLFSKIVSGPEISSEKSHVPGYILLQQRLSGLVRELTMNANRGGTGNGDYLPSHFVARFEPAHGAV